MLHKSLSLINSVSTNNMLTIPKRYAPAVLTKYLRKYYSTSNESIEMAYSYIENVPNQRTPLVIMHGLLGSKRNWNSLGASFNKQTQPTRGVYVVDARNHGDSKHSSDHTYELMATDIKAFLTTHKLPQVSLLGHSMGGRAVMYFALKYPELVEKLIVADMSPCKKSVDLSNISGLFKFLLGIDMPTNVPEAIGRKKVEDQLAETIIDKGFRAFILTSLVPGNNGKLTWKPNIKSLLANYEHISSFPEENLTYNGPVLFISGGKSDYVRTEDHEKILRLFPIAEFHVILKAGHWLHFDNPREFVSVCVAFLNKE